MLTHLPILIILTLITGTNMTSESIYAILSSKPHNQHYLIRYFKFIRSCDHQIYIKGITENHHICPKSKDLFPEYSSLKNHTWNSIHLSTRQHFISHALLAKAYGGCQIYAYWAMCHKMSNAGNRDYKINSHMFEHIKKIYKERNKETNPFNDPEIQDNIKNTFFEKYGVYNPFQSDEIKNKIKDNNICRYGVEYASQRPEVKEQMKSTNNDRLGVDYPMQSPEVQQKSKEKCLEKYGVVSPSQFKFLSIIETKKSYAKNIISRLLPELKQFY